MTLFPCRSALILVATTALFGAVAAPSWAQMPRPNFPIRQDASSPEARTTAAPEAPAVREERPMPAQPEPEGVQSRPLDAPAVRREPPPPATTPAFAPPPVRTVTKATVTGRVVQAQGPGESYKVKKGDHLATIARKMGVDLEDLARINGLKSPYRLKPGQVLKGPGSDAKAYVVGQGDTLYAIARRFSVTPQALAAANNISVTRSLSAGRRLILPEGYKDKGPVRTQVQEEVEEEPTPTPTRTRTPRARDRAEPAPPAMPVERGSTITTTRVSGKVIEVEGGASSYKVRKGDNLDAIADKMGMSRKELAQLNKLKSPYRLSLGQVLKGPPKQSKAYVPVEGDTLGLIGKRFGVTAKAIAATNGMKSTASVRPGKRLILPAGFRDRGPIKETIRTAPSAPYSPPTYTPPPERPQPERPQPAPYSPPPYSPPPTPAPTTPRPYSPPTPAPRSYPPPSPAPPASSGPLSDSQISMLGRGRFVWPLRGDILSDFGPKGTGQRNDGVNIRANTGDAVRAAAGGDVVYAGDQVPGFGNLVLVKHADGWVTAYGHLGRVDVKMQQKVVQGQQLGMAGQTGGVSEPQLHFEVRYAPSPTERARPVDPQLVLGK